MFVVFDHLHPVHAQLKIHIQHDEQHMRTCVNQKHQRMFLQVNQQQP